MNPATSPPRPSPHRKLLLRLLAVVAASFAFGFALVPLYDVFCELTGLNGKTAGAGVFTRGGIKDAASTPSRIDTGRIITVEFMATVMPGLNWQVQAIEPRIDLHPGELQTARFRVVNVSDQPLTGQAIPSVSPGNAARHFAKLDCFCFSEQALAPGESRELTVTFIVQAEIDPDVRTITLGYALFNASAPPKIAQKD